MKRIFDTKTTYSAVSDPNNLPAHCYLMGFTGNATWMYSIPLY